MPLNFPDDWGVRKTWKSMSIRDAEPFSMQHAPLLSGEELEGLWRKPEQEDTNRLSACGIVLNEQSFITPKVYFTEDWLYFKDSMGTYAISSKMRPNARFRISYYCWEREGFWRYWKDMPTDE